MLSLRRVAKTKPRVQDLNPQECAVVLFGGAYKPASAQRGPVCRHGGRGVPVSARFLFQVQV